MANAFDQVQNRRVTGTGVDIKFAFEVAQIQEGKYNAGRDKIDKYLSELTNIDMAKQEDKEYLYNRITNVVNSINQGGGINFASGNELRGVMSHVDQIYDQNVMNAISGTRNLRKLQGEIATIKEKNLELYSQINEYDALQGAYSWINDGQVGSSYAGGSYTPYTDVEKIISKDMAELKKQAPEQEITTPVLDSQGNPTGRMVTKKVKELTYDDVRAYSLSRLGANEQKQLEINGKYLYGNVPIQSKLGILKRNTEDRVTLIDNKIKSLEVQLRHSNSVDSDEVLNQIEQLKGEQQHYINTYNKVISNPNDIDYEFAKEDLINKMADAYEFRDYSVEYSEDTSYYKSKKLELDNLRYNFELEKFNTEFEYEKEKNEIDYNLKLRELSLKERELNLKELESINSGTSSSSTTSTSVSNNLGLPEGAGLVLGEYEAENSGSEQYYQKIDELSQTLDSKTINMYNNLAEDSKLKEYIDAMYAPVEFASSMGGVDPDKNTFILDLITSDKLPEKFKSAPVELRDERGEKYSVNFFEFTNGLRRDMRDIGNMVSYSQEVVRDEFKKNLEKNLVDAHEQLQDERVPIYNPRTNSYMTSNEWIESEGLTNFDDFKRNVQAVQTFKNSMYSNIIVKEAQNLIGNYIYARNIPFNQVNKNEVLRNIQENPNVRSALSLYNKDNNTNIKLEDIIDLNTDQGVNSIQDSLRIRGNSGLSKGMSAFNEVSKDVGGLSYFDYNYMDDEAFSNLITNRASKKAINEKLGRALAQKAEYNIVLQPETSGYRAVEDVIRARGSVLGSGEFKGLDIDEKTPIVVKGVTPQGTVKITQPLLNSKKEQIDIDIEVPLSSFVNPEARRIVTSGQATSKVAQNLDRDYSTGKLIDLEDYSTQTQLQEYLDSKGLGQMLNYATEQSKILLNRNHNSIYSDELAEGVTVSSTVSHILDNVDKFKVNLKRDGFNYQQVNILDSMGRQIASNPSLSSAPRELVDVVIDNIPSSIIVEQVNSLLSQYSLAKGQGLDTSIYKTKLIKLANSVR